jgi:chromosome segregation ATPase
LKTTPFFIPHIFIGRQLKWMEMKRIELKELIREILLTEFIRDKEIESKINEFGELNDEIDRLKNHLEGLKKRYSQLEGELRPVLENLYQHNQKSVQTQKYLVSIKKMGYEKTNYRYKEVFEESLEKVNGNTKKLLENLLETTKTLSKVVSSIGVQPLNETLFTKLMSGIKKMFLGLVSRIKNVSKDMDELQKVSKLLIK